jgi:uncharacterized damage-inducible protein DinB
MPLATTTSHGVDRYRRLLAYESEANARALASLETVPAGNRASAAYLRGVQVMTHNQLCRLVWLARLEGRPSDCPSDWFPVWTVDQTRVAAEEQDREWAEYLASICDSDLSKQVSYTSSEGVQYVSGVEDILTHIFNHSTYHRGQLARIVTECGGQRANTDYIAFTRLAI